MLTVLLNGTGFLLNSIFDFNLLYSDIAIISSVLFLITLSGLIVFFRGQLKRPDSQTLHSLVAVSLKFLLEMVFALIWFFIGKRIYAESVFIFFVIYLALTLFFVIVILKTLKNKSL
jgi:hypothetical protein